MSVKKRLLAMALYKKQKKKPELFKKLGVKIEINHRVNTVK